ncbi:hypothetical protein KKF91_19965 [Myxococcota bacterium]|nr:hypothetical protein [Myxococcota bacterium]MBU1432822.1 hypothetical protein [Myxococcota bacterium]MBU1897552.1 hypothetical protein [Myxococcota bacterium]
MRRALILLLSLLSLSACGPSYTLQAPERFKRFEQSDAFRYITADGVMLKAREVPNEPKAELAFWVDAMSGHLEKRGYAVKSAKACFQTTKGLDGCTLEFLVPHGAEDWVMSETLFVVGERVILVEVAGPYPLYAPLEEDLKAAMKTFDPGA